MPTNAPVHAITVRVYYEDTDAGGVVYYANYLRFFERARTELLRASGISQHALLAQSRLGFVVRGLTIDYLASARLDDELTVTAAVDRLGGASAVFVQRALRGDHPLATARVRVACVDLECGRPAPIPAAVAQALSRFIAVQETSPQ